MDQLTEFLGNNLALTAALVVIVGLLIGTVVAPGARRVRKLSATDTTRLINQEDAVVLDVRGDGEYRDGHIINAVHIPMTTLKDQLEKLEKYRERPIITVCRTGQQSATACNTLIKGGYQNVYNLQGGILAWENANLPLSKK
jgi:rhodanese-related sulfurtransferase